MIVYDIETGPLPEEELRRVYHEPTFEEFAAGCDKRWKPETVQAKYDEQRPKMWQEFVEKAALSATTGRVVAIGIGNQNTDADGPCGFDIIDCDDDEEAGLFDWWARVDYWLNQRRPMIGFNSHNFDLPFLVRRSWILGVLVPFGIRNGRYWNDLFIDLMQIWGLGGRSDYIGLTTLGEALGLGGKVEEVDGVKVSGADFHRLWRENRPVAEKYLQRDLELPLKIARRLGVV